MQIIIDGARFGNPADDAEVEAHVRGGSANFELDRKILNPPGRKHGCVLHALSLSSVSACVQL